MKKCIFVAMMALLFSCSNQQLIEGFADAKTTKSVEKSDSKNVVDSLVDKARWGDGKAFLQLADCYRDGIGVRKNLIGMLFMVNQAVDLGCINNVKDYFSLMPNDNVYKQCFEVLNLRKSEIRERKESALAELGSLDCPDAQALYGAITVECGDTIGGFETIRKAANSGSDCATMLLTMFNNNGKLTPSINKLEEIADKIPVANIILGEICRDLEDVNGINERQAAHYYLEAEKHALLTKREAKWLLSFYRNGGDIQLSDEDVRRLETFSYDPYDGQEEFVTDSCGH